MDEILTTAETLPDTIPEVEGSYDFDVTAGFNGTVTDAPVEEAPAAEEPVVEEAPTTEPENTDRDISFTAKVDHNETQVSIKESELPTYYQKAQNMDRAVQRANEAQEKLNEITAKLNRLAAVGKATLGLEGDDPDTILANMESGMTDTAIKSRARTYTNTDAEIAEAHVKSVLKDAIDESVAQFGVVTPTAESVDTSASESEEPSVRPFEEFQRDVERLIAVRPDLKGTEMPTEVMSYYKGGMDIMNAFAMYESHKMAADNEELKKQNAILQQNQASAKKAPIRSGVSGGGSVNLQEDPWTAGFNSRRW